jgi:hypothetical protein
MTELLAHGTVVLDGGLSNALEGRWHDLSSDLWTARLLRDDPDEIVAAQPGVLRGRGPTEAATNRGLSVRRRLVAGLPREPDTRGDQPLGLAARQPGGHQPRHARLVARRRGTTLQDEFVRSWLEGAPRGPDAANGLLTPLPNADERRWTERLLDTVVYAVVYAVECTRQTALALLRIRRLGVRIPPGAPCDVARHSKHLEPLTRLWSWLANI